MIRKFLKKTVTPRVYSLVFKNKETDRSLLWVVGAYSLEEAIDKASKEIRKEMEGKLDFDDFRIDLYSHDSIDTLFDEYTLKESSGQQSNDSYKKALTQGGMIAKLLESLGDGQLKIRKKEPEPEAKDKPKESPSMKLKESKEKKNTLMQELIRTGDLNELKKNKENLKEAEYKWIEGKIKSKTKK